jgi:hypothetical protein
MLLRKALRNFDALVLGAIVTNDDFVRPARLSDQAVQLLLQKSGTVVGAHGDGCCASHMLYASA